MESTVPDGFAQNSRSSPLTAPWEPIFVLPRHDRVLLGLHVRKEHTNSRGLLHGGVIAALADNAMGLSVARLLDGRGELPAGGLVTASLSVDYLGRAEIGQWLEFDTGFVHLSGSQAVAQALVSAEGAVVARANALFRMARVKPAETV